MIWLDVKDAPDYEVSNYGNVRNIKTGRILKPHLNREGGYERVDINGKHRYVHNLVADRFFACGVNDGDRVIHVDGNNLNNSISNLRIIQKNV